MDCAAVKPRMEALVSGSLPEPERALAEQHISICEGCRLELELVRAIGSQEKPPAVGQDDWTLDRIFGSEQQQNRGGQPAPASAPQPPASAEASSVFPAPGTAPAGAMSAGPRTDPPATADTMSDSAPASGKKDLSEPEEAVAPASWDFEPADAKADVKPPEESLFFATEALNRRRDTEGKKGSKLRVLLWGVGGVVGAVLLAFSSWFVLHMAGPNGDDLAPGMNAPAEPSAGDAPSQESPGEAPDPGAVQQPTDEEIVPQQDLGSEPPEVTVKRAPAGRARVSASSGSQPPPLPNATRAPGAASARHAPPPAAIQKPARSTPPPVTRAAPPEATSPNVGSNGAQYAPPPKQKPWLPPPDDEAPMEPDPAPAQAPTESAPAPSRSGTGVAPPAAGEPRSTAPSDAGKSGDKPPEVLSPIDRLHLATVEAEERGELAALRRLRGSWKSFMSKMGVGPQRARAKREYADCLWAIQSLTGSRADQKSALAAYREYLLGAPAGGADSRSVSRLRQLEDALSEKR
jgi:hypothetical protein